MEVPMEKNNKRSSSASDDDAETKKHKKSDVDTDPASSSKSLKSDKWVLEPCSESKEDLKKQKEKSEVIQELMKTIKELTKAVRKLQETLQPKPDLLDLVSLKENSKDTQDKEDTCCFDCVEAHGNDRATIFVKGFQKLRPRNEIKKMLSGVFGKCGELTRVFVPMECETRVPLGFAFINFKNPQEDNAKALKFNGRSLEGRKLKVTLASQRDEFFGYTDFGGCDRCVRDSIARLSRPPGPRSLPRIM